VPALDLALGLGMARSTANMGQAAVLSHSARSLAIETMGGPNVVGKDRVRIGTGHMNDKMLMARCRASPGSAAGRCSTR
jgi:hypothetical protein